MTLHECPICKAILFDEAGVTRHITREAMKEVYEYVFWEFAKEGCIKEQELLKECKHYKHVKK